MKKEILNFQKYNYIIIDILTIITTLRRWLRHNRISLISVEEFFLNKNT